MGAKTWMLVLSNSNIPEVLAAKPQLDQEATYKLANILFADEKLEQIGNGDLSYTCPPDNEVYMGCFPGVSIIAAKEFGIDYPSKLAQKFITAGKDGTVTLHAMHSVVDWFAYAIWVNGKLVRSLSLSPDSGIMEDIGQHLNFEVPYWSGVSSEEEEDTYPFPFHPLDLGEAALKDQFGYQLEGNINDSLYDPETIPLIRYKRLRSPWWKFW